MSEVMNVGVMNVGQSPVCSSRGSCADVAIYSCADIAAVQLWQDEKH